jgi:CRP-like cAMP-binding protein
VEYERAADDLDYTGLLSGGSNRLLEGLPLEEAALLDSLLEEVELDSTTEIAGAGEVIHWVHFPDTAVLSLITAVGGGAGVEALTVGRDGMAGLPLIAGSRTTFVRIVCQIPGRSRRIRSDLFREALPNLPELRRRVGLYSQLAFDVTSQSAACNRVHVTEERCARWLLMSQDRAGRGEFKLTQVFLAQMLGVRRPAVTVAIGVLESAGAIQHRRGRIRIIDRAGLEEAACECYSLIRARQKELLGF